MKLIFSCDFGVNINELLQEMCKNYYKGESGETKSSVVILVLILMSYCRRCVRITKEKVRKLNLQL